MIVIGFGGSTGTVLILEGIQLLLISILIYSYSCLKAYEYDLKVTTAKQSPSAESKAPELVILLIKNKQAWF